MQAPLGGARYMFLNIKRNLFNAPNTRMVVFWHITDMPQQIS